MQRWTDKELRTISDKEIIDVVLKEKLGKLTKQNSSLAMRLKRTLSRLREGKLQLDELR